MSTIPQLHSSSFQVMNQAIAAEKHMRSTARAVESEMDRRFRLMWQRVRDLEVYFKPSAASDFASVIEARSAKTEGLGPQDESAVPTADAQPDNYRGTSVS